MKAATAGGLDVSTISSCLWQPVKAVGHRQGQNSGDPGQGKKQQLPRSRHRHAACCVGEHVYVFCGKDRTSPLKDVWKFHVRQRRWEAMELRGSSLPFLQGHTAVAYKRQILIFGGTFSDNLGDIQLWTYNTDLGHLREVWIEPGAAQPLCRRDHSAVVHNNLMYVYGGFMDCGGASQELWAFNIDEEEWTEVTSLSKSKPCRRYGHSAVVADNSMWVFGGLSGLSPCADLWRYSFLLHQWSKVKGVGTPPCLSGHTACVIHQQMVVVGGKFKGKTVGDVWCFRFDNNTWQKVISTNRPVPALAFHTCVSVCPSQGLQQVTDRSCSTPHLQPPGGQHHLPQPDHFVVRPRTSPSVLAEETPGQDSCGDGKTQVMTFDERSSESFDRLDCWIHVSHKEPLISKSPDTAGFCDSSIPFSHTGAELASTEEEFLQQTKFSSDGCDDHSLDAGQHGTVHNSDIGSEKEEDPVDLLDLSDSPVLKACTRDSVPKRGAQQIFWNDLFVEDLEVNDCGDLDELKISYPSKNPFLPVSEFTKKPSVKENTGEAKAEPVSKGHYQQHKPRHQHSRYKKRSVEMQSIVPGSKDTCSTHTPRPVIDATQPDDFGVKASILQDMEQGGSSLGLSKPQVPDHEGVDRTHVQKDQNRPQVQGNLSPSTDRQQDTLEAETSFIVTEGLSQSPSSLTGGEEGKASQTIGADGDRDSAQPVTPAGNLLTVPGVHLPVGAAGGGGQEDSGRSREGTTVCEGEDCDGESFLLVVGGRSEEQGSVHPLPIALWRGVVK